MADRTPSTSNLNPSSESQSEKGESRKEYYAKRDASKVYLFAAFPRWRAFKKENNMKSDKDVAEFFLDAYVSTKSRLCVQTQTDEAEEISIAPSTPRSRDINLPSPVFTSTPGPSAMLANPRAMTWTGSFPSPIIPSGPFKTHSTTTRRSLLVESSPLSVRSSRSNPNPLGEDTCSAEETLTAEEEDSQSDDDDMTLQAMALPPIDEIVELPLAETSIEEEVFNTDIDGHDGEEPEEQGGNEAFDHTGYMSNVCEVTPEEAIQMEKCIVFTDTLMSLLTELHGSICKRPECDRVLEYRKSYVGTCLVVSWGCNAGHAGGRWAAQPSCNKIRAGNILLASALLLSGNSFAKVGLMFKFCKLQYFSKTLFTQYQSLYIAPAVNEFWEQHKQELWNENAGKDVLLSGDGRNDSPGHSAQYCTYSLADMEDHAVLQMNIIDVREAAGKSNNMERIGFERGIDKLLASHMSIKEVVTDGHLEIAALMKRDDKYKDVKHQNDVWHGGKSLAKKINAAAKTKANEDLTLWASSVRNHFWYCSKHCDKDVKNIKARVIFSRHSA